jgi:hypothetical protein
LEKIAQVTMENLTAFEDARPLVNRVSLEQVRG